ncbi:class I SAM-dependent methyltransferase [Thomasclavelia cocleata]|jgi:SAM-dependent methyltransferase|uniref:class I SAM-dependent methyltransferase n=1 Tax=Thomasclavelia cocleata TaxID=69824 RepID=UPI00241CCCC1|nr:class I SAM-dependent methyltransferase [Thomasclavelia cocleata]MCI9631344.1 class I SAM-dependent methyltransferase [Thomasclavelia cocleata]
MKNPWEEIELSDYENHMKLDSVKQLQFLNVMMKNQFNSYPIKTVMILGIAGGNGLEHINTDKIQKVYGIDINYRYLEKCIERYGNLNGVLECICADLTNKNIMLPHVDMVIANLLVEYIGYQCFQNVIMQIRPLYVSCIIQINTNDSFVSDSPYIHVFDGLNEVHHQMQEDELTVIMKNMKYYLMSRKEQILSNGKILVQLDYRQ